MQIYNLQLLRAFAALNVVFFHIIGTSEAYGFKVQWSYFLNGWGANGVDIFFVISGFIMVYVQNLKNRSGVEFIIDRVVRIVPIYWLLTIVVVIAAYIMPAAFNDTPTDVGWIISSLVFLSQPIMEIRPVLFLGWTLEYEMLFYVVFAVSIVLRKLVSPYVFVLAILTAVYFVFGVSLLVMEFFIGMLIGLFYIRFSAKETTGLLVLFVGLVGLCISIWLVDIDRKGLRVLVWGGPATLIVFGAVYAKQFKNKLFILLGDSSYSIYLIQVFTIPVFYKGLSWLGVGGSSPDLLAFLCLVCTAVAGVVSYTVLEKPMAGYFRRTFMK